MSTAAKIELFTAALLMLVGLSHIIHPRLWSQLFIDLLRLPYAGLYIGTLTLPLGLFIAVFHQVWVWDIPVIVTVVGCAWTIKGSLYLLYPAMVQRVAARHIERPSHFAWAGLMLGLVGAVVLADVILATKGAA
jgi:uncharacterized protein YjeT (DUF2065 family)